MDNKTELYHHGIKGMRWGRRRYQNPDGSLTPEGKKRYGDDDLEPDHEDSSRARAKRAGAMSDKELRDSINRLQMEKQYAQLTKKEKSRGRQMVEDALLEAGKNTIRSATESLAKAGIGVMLRKIGMNTTEGGTTKAFLDQMMSGLGVSNMIKAGKSKPANDGDQNKSDDTPGTTPKPKKKNGGSAPDASTIAKQNTVSNSYTDGNITKETMDNSPFPTSKKRSGYKATNVRVSSQEELDREFADKSVRKSLRFVIDNSKADKTGAKPSLSKAVAEQGKSILEQLFDGKNGSTPKTDSKSSTDSETTTPQSSGDEKKKKSGKKK